MKIILCALVSLWLILLSGCGQKGSTARKSTFTGSTARESPASPDRVTLYCSVDEVYAKPIIHDLEKRTGLRIDVLYDTEAAKTAGLANRIRAESHRPQGDVFWSSALLQTLLLKREGLLQPYKSPAAKDVPAAFKDPQGTWTGMGLRARIIVFHGSVKSAGPQSLLTLLEPTFKNKVGISNPQFGTASDWAAALATRWGIKKTLDYFRALKRNGVQVLPGNSVVAEKVARGELLAGVTDTDDFMAQIDKNDNIYFGSVSDKSATDPVLIPGSVAILQRAPDRAAAHKLVDALLDVSSERQLSKVMSVIPLREPRSMSPNHSGGAPGPPWDYARDSTPNDTARWPAAWDEIREPLAQILLSD